MITPGFNGFLHLANMTPHGIQYSIENFTTLGEARAFCYRQNPPIKASYEIDGNVLLDRECLALMELKNGTTLLSDIANAIGTSIRAMKMSADRLRYFGMIAYDGDAGSASELVITEHGRAVVTALSG